MQEHNLFLIFIERLNKLHANYMITGSVASMLYGEPRITHDVDVVLEISLAEAARIGVIFPLEEFYAPPTQVLRTELNRLHRGHFNLIHHETGFKADIYLCGEEPLQRWGLERACSLEVEGHEVRVAPVEYVIVKKLSYFREGGSEKHLRDIQAMLRVMPALPKKEEIEDWVIRLGLQTEWAKAKVDTKFS